MAGTPFDDIIQQLRNIEETLGERALTMLREAVQSGATSRPAGEKPVTQARRAVEKAINLLQGADLTSD